MLESTNKILSVALKINSSYGSVIPVGKDKRPLVEWKQYQTVKATEDEIRGWFERYPEAQLGLVTGRISKCVVVDIDCKDGKVGDYSFLPQNTTIVQTGGGGRHYYYKYYSIGNKAGIRDLVDIRGDGGYVVLPPSVSDKGEYKFLQDMEWPPFPAHLFGEGTKPEKPVEHNVKETFEILNYDGHGTGQRNHRMAEYIGKVLVKFSPDIWEEVAYKWIQSQNKKNNPPLPEHELRQTYLSIAKSEAMRLGTGDAKRFHNRVAPDEAPADFSITTPHELMTMEIPEFPYVVDKMIPKRAITAITADSGKGKSMVAWILASYIAKGLDVFDKYHTERQKILYVDQEMDRDLIAERYRSIIKEEMDMEFMIEQSWNITNDSHLDWLIKYIKEKRITMVVFDTLTTIHDKEENSASEMREVNKRLLQLIAEANVTVMYLHHHRKPTPGMPMSQSSSRGSTEIMAKIASHFTLDHIGTEVVDYENMEHKKTTKQFVLRQEKARRPESVNSIKFEITYDDLVKTTTWEYLGENEAVPAVVQQAHDAILQFFTDHPTIKSAHTSVIREKIEATGEIISQDAVNRALKIMCDKKILIKRKSGGKSNMNLYSLAENQNEE